MANDTVPDKGPITRSSREAVSKKTIATASANATATATPNRKSERLEKRTPPSVAVKMDQKKKTAMTVTPTPLRRSERTRIASSSCSPSSSSSSPSASKSSKTRPKKQLAFENEDEKDCHEKTNEVDRSTKDGDEGGAKIDGDRIDECLEGNCLDSSKDNKNTLPPEDATAKEMRAEPMSSGLVKEVLDDNVSVNSLVSTNASTSEPSGAFEKAQSDSCKEGTSQMLGSRDSTLNENLIRKCVEHDNGENSMSAKRKRTMQDMHSDAPAMLVDNDSSNIIEDAHPSRIINNVVETSELCSKRIRRISLSDVKKDWRKSTNNDDQTSSKSNGEKLPTRNKEGNSGEPLDTERPQGNTLETEKIRKQQRNLHLLLKPKIANLCEILRLPDNVKTLVENCLEYTMNNYQICTEPASILQAFQLSLCWIAASLLSHKLDFEASLVLAKQHLNFDCEKELVDEINSRLWVLKENFLSLTGNSNVAGYTRASESSNGVNSYIEVTPEELVKNDNSKDIKNVQRRKGQWNRLLLMQLEEKQKLKKDMENETTEFLKRYRIEWVAMRSSSPHDAMTDEKLRVFNSEYVKRIRELEKQHETRRKHLEAKQLEIRLAFQESTAPDELLNPVASNELGTKVEFLPTRYHAQHHNAPKTLVTDHVAEGNGFNDTVEVMTRTRMGVGSSKASDANASVVVPCSSPVELQTPLVKHVDTIEMDIVASKDGPVSGNKCNIIAENEYDNQGNLIDKHSKSREQCSDPDKGEGCVNFSGESHNDFGQDAITQVLLSSSEEICDGETLVAPSGEVALTVSNISSSNVDCVEIPSSRQGELNGTILSKPVCCLSIVVEANDSNDGAKNMAPLNSQSSEEHIPSVNTTRTPNCENAAKMDQADDNYGSNNAETVNSPLSDERISSWKSKSSQDHVRNENVTCMLNCENSTHVHEDDDGNGSNNVILNSPLIDERNADGAIVLKRDAHVGMLETVNFTPSTGQISGSAVDISVLDSVLSTPCRADSPVNSSDANAIILSNQPSLEKQNPYGVSSSIPAGQIPVEVLDGEEAVGMPGTVSYTDYPENVTLNSPSMDQISNRGPVLDGDLSSGPCTTSPRNGWTLPGEQISVLVPENSHVVAECQLTDSVVLDKSATLDQLEGVCRTMTENSLSQETPVSRPDDRDTVIEIQNDLVSSPVDIVPANQSINDSLVMEPPEQEGQLPSAGFLSSNQDLSNTPSVTATENQPSIDDDLPNHIPEASIEIQNQTVVQRASNLELDSCSRQVVHPASNMDLDSVVSGGVRLQSSDTRNLSSTLTEINNHPIQSASRSASSIFPLLSPDPLKNESERLRRLSEQNMKDCENKKLQLKCDFEKELEELCRKFEIKRKEMEAELQKIMKDLDTQFNIVLKNRILAEAFRAKSLDLKVSGAPGMRQDSSFTQHYYQLASQENAMRPSPVPGPSSCGPPATSLRSSPVPGPSSCGPPAASLQSSYITTTSQTMVPPIQATHSTSGTFSSVSARLPHINSLSSPLGNVQTVGGIRAPAPHLQPYRPATSVPTSSLFTVPHVRPSQLAPCNIPATSPPFPHWTPRPMPATFQSVPHRGLRPGSTGGLPTPAMNSRIDAFTPPGINVPNVRLRLSDLASLNISKFVTSSSTPANSTRQGTDDIVCLSDDDE